eukprot:9191202-Pyramimonas_sp.AAC.1
MRVGALCVSVSALSAECSRVGHVGVGGIWDYTGGTFVCPSGGDAMAMVMWDCKVGLLGGPCGFTKPI